MPVIQNILAKYLYAIFVWWQRKPIMKLHLGPMAYYVDNPNQP